MKFSAAEHLMWSLTMWAQLVYIVVMHLHIVASFPKEGTGNREDEEGSSERVLK